MKKDKSKKLSSDYDSGWKEIIEIYFKQLLEFYYPALDKIVDHTKGYTFLDKKLTQILRTSKIKNREVDKLVKVYLKNGKEQWILFHIEIQSQKATDIAKRMYIYNYKIFDKYEKM